MAPDAGDEGKGEKAGAGYGLHVTRSLGPGTLPTRPSPHLRGREPDGRRTRIHRATMPRPRPRTPEISMLKRLGLMALFATLSTAACARLVAGGNIDIDEPIDGNLYVAGGNVSITAPVSGNVRIAGGDISITGNVGGKLAVAGGHVKLDGPVAGNATVSSGTLDLGPNARISGKLAFNRGHLDQDPATPVVGS